MISEKLQQRADLARHTSVTGALPAPRSAATPPGLKPVVAPAVLACERKASLIVTAILVKATTVEKYFLALVC